MNGQRATVGEGCPVSSDQSPVPGHQSLLFVHLLEFQARLVAGSEIYVAAAHLFERTIALFARGEPVFLAPVAADQILEGIGRAQLEANAEGALLGDRSGEVVFVNDGHNKDAVRQERAEERARRGNFRGRGGGTRILAGRMGAAAPLACAAGRSKVSDVSAAA